MQTVERECLSVVEDLIHAAGYSTAVRRGRHLRVTVRSAQGQEGHITISTTPRGDLECHRNFARQKANRVIRAFRLAEAQRGGETVH